MQRSLAKKVLRACGGDEELASEVILAIENGWKPGDIVVHFDLKCTERTMYRYARQFHHPTVDVSQSTPQTSPPKSSDFLDDLLFDSEGETASPAGDPDSPPAHALAKRYGDKFGFDANDFEAERLWVSEKKQTVQMGRKAKRIEIDAEDILAALELPIARPAVARAADEARSAVVCIADLQIGKADGNNGQPENVVDRVYSALNQVFADLAHESSPPKHVVIAMLGDCIEGFQSQGGKATFGTLSLTTQIRLLRQVILHAVRLAAAYTAQTGGKTTVAAIAGNHDEAVRLPITTGPTDSHDLDACRAIQTVCELAGDAELNAVEFLFPEEGEVTLAVETADGSTLLLTHGHHFKAGQGLRWWKDQAFHDENAARAGVLLSGHYHHLSVNDSGPKTHLQCPSMESDSAWYRHKTGEIGCPGMIVLQVCKNRMRTFTNHTDHYDAA